MVLYFLISLASSIFVPTPSVQDIISGSFIFSLEKSKTEPNPPMFLKDFKLEPKFSVFFEILAICLTNLFADAMLTPLLL